MTRYQLRHITQWSWVYSSEEGTHFKFSGAWFPVYGAALPLPHPNAIHFFQFRLVYSQSSFSRLTKRVLHMPTAASYKSSERDPGLGPAGRARRKVSVGCKQLRNDNHTRLSQTLQLPSPQGHPHLPLLHNRGGGWGASPSRK